MWARGSCPDGGQRDLRSGHFLPTGGRLCVDFALALGLLNESEMEFNANVVAGLEPFYAHEL